MQPNLSYKNYPKAFIISKILALVTFFFGVLFLVDFHLPSHMEEEVIETSNVNTMRRRGDVRVFDYYITTRNYQFRASFEDPAFADVGDIIVLEKSAIFNWPKRLNLKHNEILYPFSPRNIFIFEAFFAKFLMLSLFALIYKKPKFWMIGLVILNFIVLLLSLQISLWIIIGIFFAIAILIFIISLRENNTNVSGANA